ncbi:MAG: winged helix-turn-helix domain-containing protein [Candidatus Woesearchaeota archaeon]
MSPNKRRFRDIRNIILDNLSTGQKTINQIASETDINWKTVDNHITYLIGKGLAREVFSSKYVRIIEITERGSERLHKGETGSMFEKKGEVRIG